MVLLIRSKFALGIINAKIFTKDFLGAFYYALGVYFLLSHLRGNRLRKGPSCNVIYVWLGLLLIFFSEWFSLPYPPLAPMGLFLFFLFWDSILMYRWNVYIFLIILVFVPTSSPHSWWSFPLSSISLPDIFFIIFPNNLLNHISEDFTIGLWFWLFQVLVYHSSAARTPGTVVTSGKHFSLFFFILLLWVVLII